MLNTICYLWIESLKFKLVKLVNNELEDGSQICIKINVVVCVSMILLDRYFILININGISFLSICIFRERINYLQVWSILYSDTVCFRVIKTNIHQHFSNLTHNNPMQMFLVGWWLSNSMDCNLPGSSVHGIF